MYMTSPFMNLRKTGCIIGQHGYIYGMVPRGRGHLKLAWNKRSQSMLQLSGFCATDALNRAALMHRHAMEHRQI
jgi:hypothetical protein